MRASRQPDRFLFSIVATLIFAGPTLGQTEEIPLRLREHIARNLRHGDHPSAAGAFDTEVKITPGEVSRGKFGHSVAISGDTAIVGAYSDDAIAKNRGSAYVFQRDEGGPDNWGQVTKITASDGAAWDRFGYSVAIDGDTAIVGSDSDGNNGLGIGAAYVFGRDVGGANRWGQVTKITAGNGAEADSFGQSVAISGDTAIVGAYGDDDNGDHSGSAYVFQRDEGGPDNWGRVTKITASDGAADDRFGQSVAISGDTAIVGAYGDGNNGPDTGAAYVFGRDVGGANRWGQVTKITAGDGAEREFFGWSVAISGNTIVVGAQWDDDNGERSGAAYVFQRDEGGPDNWGQVTKITAGDGSDRDYFGASVAISGDAIIVGAFYNFDSDGWIRSGSAYVFAHDEGGAGNWGQVKKILPSDGDSTDYFGFSVAVSGDTTIVGAVRDDHNSGKGSAYVYSSTPCSVDKECSDSNFCNGSESCDTTTGKCLPGTPIECDDGDACNGVESCDPVDGSCIPGTIDDCDINLIDDSCDLIDCSADPGCLDCNENGSLDRCDISAGELDVNGNGVPDACESPCSENSSCDDSDACSFDRCIDSLCFYDLDAKYGDVAGVGGVCGPDGDVALTDILSVLDGFAGQFADGCEQFNIDIAGTGGSCEPNDSIDLADILSVLDAFSGQDNCCAGRR